MRAILDLRGCVIHAYSTGVDPDGRSSKMGNKINTPGYALEKFITRYLSPIMQDFRLNDIIAVTDAGNAYRKSIYPEYKANREKDKDEQLSLAHRDAMSVVLRLLESLGIPHVNLEGAEADDVVAFLVAQLPGPKVVYTVDQDLLALESDTCAVMLRGAPSEGGYIVKNSKKEVILVVPAKYVPLYKSICGDPSDNYSGVPGIGPTRFKDMVESFGWDGMDELTDVVSEYKFQDVLLPIVEQTRDKTLEALYEHRNAWNTCWLLANLAPSLVGGKFNGKFNLLNWTKRVPSREKVTQLLQANGCAHLQESMEEYLPLVWIQFNDGDCDTTLKQLRPLLEESPFVSLDWETTDQLRHPAFIEAANGRQYVDMLSSTITGAGFTFGRNLQYTFYSTYDHANSANLDRQFLVDVCKLIPAGKPIVAHNAAFERCVMLNTLQYDLPDLHDTMVMASHTDENSSNGLKDLSRQYLNYEQLKYSDVVKPGTVMSDYSAEHIFKYGADDPLVTAHLYDFFKMIMEIEGTWGFCLENEFDAIYEVSNGFLAGVSLDVDVLRQQRTEDQAALDANMANMRRLISENQTAESIQQGAKAIFEERWPVEAAKFRHGQASKAQTETQITDEDMAERLRQHASELRKRILAEVTYQDYVKTPKLTKFSPTVAGVNAVLGALGVEEKITSVSKKQMILFCARNLEKVSEEAREFLQLFNDASGHTKDDHTWLAYRRLEALACDVLGRGVAEDDKYSWSGSELNMGSPKQMQTLLYGMIGVPMRLRQFKCSNKVLSLGLDHKSVQADEDAVVTAIAQDTEAGSWQREALESLLAARKCDTRLNMFYNVYEKWIHPCDGLIHPQINTVGTETRRPSGSNPNPLQWPKRGEGVKFRRAILPNRKLRHNLVGSADWSQQELRVAGALSGDEALLDCYIGKDVEHAISAEVKNLLGAERYARLMQTDTKDVHTQTACGSLKESYEVVAAALKDESSALYKAAKDARLKAKPTNFGGTYGIGPAKLARQLIIPAEDAKKFLEDKKQQYCQFEEYRKETIDRARQRGYITTAFGSRRHVFAEIDSADDGIRSHCERSLVNYTIQGVCADNLKRVLKTCRKRGLFKRTGAALIAPIYDEIAFSFHSDVGEDLIMELHEIMTMDIPGFAVPMLVEPSVGVNFADQYEIGAFPTPTLIRQAVDKALTGHA